MKNLLFVSAFVSIVGWGPFSFFSNNSDNDIGSSSWISSEVRKINSQADNIDPKVLKISLTAYQKARQQGRDDKGMLTIIDYSKPSSERRLWVVDMNTDKVLFNTWVAHGKNSGGDIATSFSNDPRSLKSSLGVFETSDVYSGKHGESLRVRGLERGVNDNAYRRNVVFHSAWYAGGDVAKERGMLGRSWGCMAVSQDTIRPLINTIKGKTLVVAYYPDREWLHNSSFLT